jgi:hypothetical protein
MKKKILSALALCAVLSITASAQKTITFDSKPVKKGSRKEEVHGDNSLTLGIASLINGYTPLYYERKLTKFMSVCVGGGFTYRSYMNDFGAIVWNDGENSNYSGVSNIHDDYSSYKYRQTSPGLYAALSPHFYFNDAPLDGFYIAPMVEVKQYRYNAKLADVTIPLDNYSYSYEDRDVPRTTDVFAEHMNCIDLTFNSGGHYELRNHMALGWNIGVGIRSMSAERLDIGAVGDGAGTAHYVNNVHSYSATRPLVVFNFVVGGWF